MIERNYFYKLRITCGEYEFESFGTVQATNDKSAWKKADEVARHFYDEGDPSGDGYYFNGGELFVEVSSIQEVADVVVKALKALNIV